MGLKALTPTVTHKRAVADRLGEEVARNLGLFGGHRGALCPLHGGGLKKSGVSLITPAQVLR